MRRAALRFPSASAAQAVISEMTKPAPRDCTWVRNGASVTPDMGAKRTGLGSFMPPIDGAGALLDGWVTVSMCTRNRRIFGAAYSLAKTKGSASAALQYSCGCHWTWL